MAHLRRGQLSVYPPQWTLTVLLVVSSVFGADRLGPLSENPRYLQYKGLPCVLFWGTHHWGWRGYPDKGQIGRTSQYANFITLQASEYRYSNYPALWKKAHDMHYWRQVRQSVEYARDRDMIVHLYFYDGNYSPELGKYDAPTHFFDHSALDDDLDDLGLPGVTRRDIHLAMIDQAVEHLWNLPNVLFDPVFEMVNTYRWGINADEFQRWWVDQFKSRGAQKDAEKSHLFGTMWGGNGNYRDGKQSHPRGNQRESHPYERGMDVLIGEHTQDGFFVEPSDNTQRVYQWQVPMLRMGLHAPDWHRNEIQGIDGPAHDLMIQQILHGIHTAETYNYDGKAWTTALTDARLHQWMLQARWYLENIRSWRNEPARYGGDEITRSRLPQYAPSQRPTLLNPDGYNQGVRYSDNGVIFACMYRDEDGDEPIQAQVWVDINADGRFDPDPDHGERVAMTALGQHDYRAGVLFCSPPIIAKDRPLRYVFRFADCHWLPPVQGYGVVPIGSYTSLTLNTNPHPNASHVVSPEGIQFVPFEDVRLSDKFWAPRLSVNREVTVPHNLDKCQEVGIVDNFAKAAGLQPGDYVGLPNWDEFLYKAIEAASYALIVQYDRALDQRLDRIIQVIAAAQEEDGYLRTIKTLARRDDPVNPAHAKWANLKDNLELYCAGHLFEAAVAHHQATGKTSLLAVARRKADLIAKVFGPSKNRGVPGHEEIELALVRLYEATDDETYLNLARFFVDQRGNAEGHTLHGSFCQDHRPVVDQSKAVGQAPRATYLYSAMADLAYHTGTKDYLPALDRLWDDVAGRKMYITGGIGSLHSNEGFGPPYELPNRTAYTEVCAAISFPMWNQRMFKLYQDAKYVDLMELTLYNNFLAGVSLSGDRYFYACPPESDGRYQFNLGWCPDGFDVPYRQPSATRKEWFPCACCPPNLARYMFQIPGMLYAVEGKTVYVNMFAASDAELTVADSRIAIRQETNYPWDGKIRITVSPPEALELDLRIRIPGWAIGRPAPSNLYRYVEASSEPVELYRNDIPVPVVAKSGFVSVRRRWRQGDTLDLKLPMPVRRVLCHPNVKANAGEVALQRGPVVYCVEAVDNGDSVLNLAIADDEGIQAEYQKDFLGGITVLRGNAVRAGRDPDTGAETIPFLAIPYCTWSNRGVGEMAVWLGRNESQPPQHIPQAANQSGVLPENWSSLPGACHSHRVHPDFRSE